MADPTEAVSGLIERIEAAGANQQGQLIAEAWVEVNPAPPRDWGDLPAATSAVTDDQAAKLLRHSDWRNAKGRIERMLACGAYVDAGMSMVNDLGGAYVSVFWRVGNDGEGGYPGLFKAEVLIVSPLTSKQSNAVADTAALALTSATLRARQTTPSIKGGDRG